VGLRNKLGLRSHFDFRYSKPLDSYPLARNFPQIRFVLPHFGAGLFREALMLADACPNVRFDTSNSSGGCCMKTLTFGPSSGGRSTSWGMIGCGSERVRPPFRAAG
jgi:Amidohydrolase